MPLGPGINGTLILIIMFAETRGITAAALAFRFRQSSSTLQVLRIHVIATSQRL
jgi:hypothetical protein